MSSVMMASDKEDYICPICMCIFIEPVTMPCKHSLCMPCYKQTVDKANLSCPICRLRISVWARRATKMNLLVDKVKWDAVKKAFPEKVQDRLEGKESQEDVMDDAEYYEAQQRRIKELSKPGEIRQEYEAAVQKLQHQLEEQAKEEEEASAALIKTLQQEEEKEKETLKRQREELDRIDREVAEVLQESIKSDADRVTLPEFETSIKSFIVPSVSNKVEVKAVANGIKKGKNKQPKQPVNNSLTLMTFFSPVSHRSGSTSSGSNLKYPKESNLIDSDSYSSDSSQSSHTNFSDNYSQNFSPHSSTLLETSSSVLEIHCWNKHSDKTFSNQGPNQTTVTSEPTKHATEINKTKQQNPEDKNRFIDCLSDFTSFTKRVETHGIPATSCTERPETRNTHASILDEITGLQNDAVNAESAHMTNYFQPIVKCKRISPEQIPKDFAAHPPIITMEIEKSAANNKLNLSTSGHPSIHLHSGSVQISNLDIDDKITCPTQDLYVKNASNMRHIRNVCDNSSQNSFTVTQTVSSKVGKITQASNSEHHQTLPEAQVLKPKLDSDNGQRVIFIESINESLKNFTNAAPTIKPVTWQTGKDGYCFKFNNGFPDENEMKENDSIQNEEQKSNNTEKGIMESNNYENKKKLYNNYEKREMERHTFKKGKSKSANFENEKLEINTIKKRVVEKNNDRKESNSQEKKEKESNNPQMEINESFNTMTDLSIPESCKVSVTNCNNDINITCGDSNTCNNYGNCVTSTNSQISSQLFPNSVNKFGGITEANFSKTDTICNVEKQNKNVTFSSAQQSSTRTTSEIFNKKDLINTSAKDLKKTSKSKKSKSLLKVENKALFVSIDHWCVCKKNDKVEEENGLKLDGDHPSTYLMDKTEFQNISHRVCEDECKDRVKEQVWTLENHKGKRENVSNFQNDASVSAPKKLRMNDPIDQSSLGLGAEALDVLCPQNFGHDKMSQEQKDHLLAMRLQKMYAKLDKQKIVVDRFKGSKDQYLLRKKRK